MTALLTSFGFWLASCLPRDPLLPSNRRESIPRDSIARDNKYGPNMAHSASTGAFPTSQLTIGAGVAIFHLATSRVVVCYHTRDKYYFLPKGRRNANEETGRAAEREGFEESGYRNRLLPLPILHRQPEDPDEGFQKFVTEPVWTKLSPLKRGAMYLCHWYVAETVPRSVEEGYEESGSYVPPMPFPRDQSLRKRIELDSLEMAEGEFYEPVRHEGTGVDEEEAWYSSSLVPVDETIKLLKGTIRADVVKSGWEAIQLRLRMEAEAAQ